MNIKTVFIYLTFIGILLSNISAQSSLDSLKSAYNSEINDSARVNLLLKIARTSGVSSENGFDYLKQALELAKAINYYKGLAISLDQLGVIDRNKSNYGASLNYHMLALQYIAPYGSCREKAIILNNIGVVYRRLDELSKAAHYHLMALKIAEGLNDLHSVCISTNSLGNIFLSQDNYAEALKNFSIALSMEKKLNNRLGEAINLNNIGLVYAEQKNYAKAIEYLKKSLNLNKKLKNEKGIAICYNSLGEVYYHAKKYQTAIDMYTKSLMINQHLGDRIYTAESYINIGGIQTLNENFAEAELNIRKGLKIASEIGSKIYLEQAYSKLSDLLARKGRHKEALEAYKKSIIYKDNILNERSNNSIARLKTIYETEKKEKEIQSQKAELTTRKKELSKERALKLLFISCFAAMILVSVLLFRNSRLKKKANIVLTNYNRDMNEKNRILMMQKEEILAQRDQIEDRNKVVSKAFDLIDNKNKSIIENIHYAFQIQNALLPSIEKIKEHLPQLFIIYKPKDIVSGDFYWAAQKNNKLIVTIADCTGHGVSGAFMSILGISALNEIVNEKGITQANQILNSLRERIIWSLQQNNKFWEARDGIDMAILSFDFAKRKVSFSGANASIILIRNGVLTQIKGDKMPVSIFPEIIPFCASEFDLMNGDMIYLYTDGYYHQFGGLFGKKFGTKQFKSLLLEIHKMDVNRQESILDSTFHHWLGENEQLDDILLMGISVTEEMFQSYRLTPDTKTQSLL